MELVSEADRRKTLIALPEPVDERLELLIRVARATGIQVSRSQMLAAMIAAAPTAPAGLKRMVTDYMSVNQTSFSKSHPHGDLPAVTHRGRPRR